MLLKYRITNSVNVYRLYSEDFALASAAALLLGWGSLGIESAETIQGAEDYRMYPRESGEVASWWRARFGGELNQFIIACSEEIAEVLESLQLVNPAISEGADLRKFVPSLAERLRAIAIEENPETLIPNVISISAPASLLEDGGE